MSESASNVVLIISNPKEHKSYRVNVPEDREDRFKQLMEQNGFKFTLLGSSKQLAFTVNLDTVIRQGK